jgi:hypothetical protein
MFRLYRRIDFDPKCSSQKASKFIFQIGFGKRVLFPEETTSGQRDLNP